jgi:hypothetical protein
MANPALKMPTHELMGKVAQSAFHNWASKDKKYKKLYKQLSPEAKSIIEIGLSEAQHLRPGYFDLWWTYEHMRFKRVRNDETRLAHELAYNFLSKFARGELNSDTQNKDGQASTKRGRANKVHRAKGARES